MQCDILVLSINYGTLCSTEFVKHEYAYDFGMHVK